MVHRANKHRIEIDIPLRIAPSPHTPTPIYIGDGVWRIQAQAGDARDAHVHARNWFYIASKHFFPDYAKDQRRRNQGRDGCGKD